MTDISKLVSSEICKKSSLNPKAREFIPKTRKLINSEQSSIVPIEEKKPDHNGVTKSELLCCSSKIVSVPKDRFSTDDIIHERAIELQQIGSNEIKKCEIESIAKQNGNMTHNRALVLENSHIKRRNIKRRNNQHLRLRETDSSFDNEYSSSVVSLYARLLYEMRPIPISIMGNVQQSCGEVIQYDHINVDYYVCDACNGCCYLRNVHQECTCSPECVMNDGKIFACRKCGGTGLIEIPPLYPKELGKTPQRVPCTLTCTRGSFVSKFIQSYQYSGLYDEKYAMALRIIKMQTHSMIPANTG
jgi:hypothetical protein